MIWPAVIHFRSGERFEKNYTVVFENSEEFQAFFGIGDTGYHAYNCISNIKINRPDFQDPILRKNH